jgi:hypothetical protein
VQQWLNRALPRVNSLVPVEIVGTVAEFNQRTDLEAPSDVRGIAYDGSVFLIAENIGSRREAQEVLAHELIGHVGLEQSLGKAKFDSLVTRVQRMKRTDRRIQSIAEKLQQEYIDTDGNYSLDAATEAKEILAQLAERNPKFGLIREIVSAIRSWLASVGLANVDSAAIELALVQAAKYVETAQAPAAMQTEQPLFSRSSIDSQARGAVDARAKQAIRSLPDYAQGPASVVWDTIRDAASKGLNHLSFTRDLIERVGDKLPGAKQLFEALRESQAERLRREKAASDIVTEFDRLPRTVQSAVNQFLLDSTEKQRWGYQPEWRDPVSVDAAMKVRFDALPKGAQSVVKAVNKHGHDTLREKREAMNRRIVESFDRRIARSPERADELEAAKAEALRTAGTYLAELPGPYTPLKRFGKYVVTGMSPRYAAELEKAKQTGETAALDALKSDGKHYWVSFAESRAEAAKLRDDLGQRGMQSDYWQKSKFKQDFAIDFRAFDALKAAIRNDAGQSKQANKSAAALEDMVDDLIMQSLAEHHARQANQQRRGIKGFDSDMMRAFATQGQADAFFLANLNHSRAVNEALFEVERQVRTPSAVSREDKSVIANHLFDIYTRSITNTPTPLQDNLALFNSVWFLLLSPAYYAQNSLQPVLMTLPYLTKDVSYTSASRALIDGYRALAPMLRGRSTFESFDFNQLAPDDRAIIQALTDRNVIDVTIETELGGFSHVGSNKAKKALTALRRLPGKLEVINRVSSALAAYKLAREKLGKDHAGALDYAEKVTAVTHGDYSQLNAPTALTSFQGSKLLFQFRKFQLIQIAYTVRLAKQAIAPLNEQERAGAIRALAFTLGQQSLLTGMMGLPAFALASFFISLMTGDDEPDDLERKAREGLLSLGFSQTERDMIMNGIPGPLFGSSITAKVGMGNMLSLFPFTDWGVDSKEGVQQLIVASMGPTAGVGMMMADGLGLIGQGDYHKGLEKLVPKGMRDVAASLRMASDGATDRRDTEVLQREDLSAFDLISNALGLPTKIQTQRWSTNSQKYAYEQYFNDRTSSLKREYSRAFRDGKPRFEIEREWRNLQAAKRRNGFRTQPISDLRGSVREQRERNRNVAGGVPYDSGSRGFVERTSQL